MLHMQFETSHNFLVAQQIRFYTDTDCATETHAQAAYPCAVGYLEGAIKIAENFYLLQLE